VAAYPGRETVGFHLTKLFSPLAQLDAIVGALQTTDETKRREAWNQDLGEPYTPTGGQLTDAILDGCRREYAHGPAAQLRAVAGVDVGKALHVVIRAREAQGDSRQLWAGESSFAELPGLLRRFRVRTTVMDALPETTKAREFQAAQPAGSVWLAYYPEQPTGNKKTEAATWDEKEGTVSIDRTRALDEMFARFYEASEGQPGATLPAGVRDVRDYYAQLRAPIRVIERSARGLDIARYVEAGADHYAHAENYCLTAENAPRRPAGILVQGTAKGW